MFFDERIIAAIITVVRLPFIFIGRITIGVVAFSALCSNASAGWTEIPIDGDSRIFFDRATIQKSGNLVRMVWLQELNEPTSIKLKARRRVSYTSQIFEAEYDCVTSTARIDRLTYYSGSMGGGVGYESPSRNDVVFEVSDGNRMWRATFMIACGK
jgi:hypothetical protein